MSGGRTRRNLLLVLVGCVALAAAVLAARQWSKDPNYNLEWADVTRGPLRETVSATGALEALQTVNVGTQVSGTIQKIYVDFNSPVKKGQRLALIDPIVLDSQLEQARADLERARATYQDAVEQRDEGKGLV